LGHRVQKSGYAAVVFYCLECAHNTGIVAYAPLFESGERVSNSQDGRYKDGHDGDENDLIAV
jgi:hypothetical protein